MSAATPGSALTAYESGIESMPGVADVIYVT